MFKKCKNSVCSTNSIVIGPNPKNVTVVCHTKSEEDTGNHLSNQGTNLWLKNGGVLPYVSADPTLNELPSQPKPVKQLASTTKLQTVSKQLTKPQARPLPKVTSKANTDSQTQQASFKSLNSTFTLAKSCKDNKVCEKQDLLVVDKENYMNIISHFNEQDYPDVYNPGDFSEKKNKPNASSSSISESVLQTTTALEKIHYSEIDTAKILLSIREELKSWNRNEESNN